MQPREAREDFGGLDGSFLHTKVLCDGSSPWCGGRGVVEARRGVVTARRGVGVARRGVAEEAGNRSGRHALARFEAKPLKIF